MKEMVLIKKTTAVVLAIGMLCFASGCAKRTVSALDYALEDQMHGMQQGEAAAAEPYPVVLDELPVEAPTVSPTTETPDVPFTPTEAGGETIVVQPDPYVQAQPDINEGTTQPENTPVFSPELPVSTQTPEIVEPTPVFSPELPVSTQTPEIVEPTPVPVFAYTLYVQDTNGAPLSGVRVSVYANGELLYTGFTDGAGSFTKSLPQGSDCSARAELAGYTEKENRSSVTGAQTDATAHIYMELDAASDHMSAQPPTAPENAVTPAPSATPVSSAIPVPTVSPAPAQTPQNTITPAPSATPESSATPIPSAAPTQTPENTATPEPTPSATPLPTPTPYSGGKVTITAADIEAKTGDAAFDLLSDVSAVDEKGNSVYVWVLNDGWFSLDTAGTYTVIYAAMQGNELVTVSRQITVSGDSTAPSAKIDAPKGNSNQRYKELLEYRNEIYDELAPRIQTLTAQLRSYIATLTKDGSVTYLKETSLLEDDSEPENSTADMGIETVGVVQTEQASVSNWADILAVFIAKNTKLNDDIEDPLDLMELRNISWDGLESVFKDMFKLTVQDTDTGVNVLVSAKSYQDMIRVYNLDGKQTDLLYTLMQPEFQRVFASLTGNTAFEDMSDDEIASALASLPEGLSTARESVVEKAYSLVGKVSYFWGGKSNSTGWNEGWGLPRTVTSQGSKTSGTERSYGLDCSGFVSWAFINAAGDESVLNVIGNGSSNQWSKSTSVGWDEGQPGDLAFFAAPGERDINHVGIIVSVNDDGSYLVAHCSSSKNGVVVTDAWSTGFRYIRRPILFQRESNAAQDENSIVEPATSQSAATPAVTEIDDGSTGWQMPAPETESGIANEEPASQEIFDAGVSADTQTSGDECYTGY